LSVAIAQSGSYDEKAKQILDATNVEGGLIVHIGCSEGKLTAKLRANDSYLVHGLGTEAKNVEKAREYIKSLGIYGPVSIGKPDERAQNECRRLGEMAAQLVVKLFG